MREINRDMVRDLVGNHILPLYGCVKGVRRIDLTLSKTEATRYIAHTLRQAQFTRKQIRDVLEVTERQLDSLLGRKITKGFKRSIALIDNPLVLLRKSDEYAFEYTITPKMVERMIIEDLAKAGWTAHQIKLATGFNLRTIQRIRKEYKRSTV
jgi:hypothetical protein